MTANATVTAAKKLKNRIKIVSDATQAKAPPAKAKAAKPVAADKSASASQVYHHDVSVDFTI